MKFEEYIDKLASSSPTPGGGSASAVSGMIGISLVEMAIALTKDKKKYKEYEALYSEATKVLQENKNILKWGIEEDAKAFDEVMKLYRKPDDSKEHANALQDAFIYAAEVPLKSAYAIVDSFKAITLIIDHINPWVVSDVIGGLEINMGALRSILLNTAINLHSITEDASKETLHTEMKACLVRGEKLYKVLRQKLYTKKEFAPLFK